MVLPAWQLWDSWDHLWNHPSRKTGRPSRVAPRQAGCWQGRPEVLSWFSPGHNLIKHRGRFVTCGVNKVSSRLSQGENQREKYLPRVTQ